MKKYLYSSKNPILTEDVVCDLQLQKHSFCFIWIVSSFHLKEIIKFFQVIFFFFACVCDLLHANRWGIGIYYIRGLSIKKKKKTTRSRISLLKSRFSNFFPNQQVDMTRLDSETLFIHLWNYLIASLFEICSI